MLTTRAVSTRDYPPTCVHITMVCLSEYLPIKGTSRTGSERKSPAPPMSSSSPIEGQDMVSNEPLKVPQRENFILSG
jgi:hypothetical protein